MRTVLLFVGIAAAVCWGQDPLQAAAEMIERYRQTGDGAYLAKSEALIGSLDTPAARRVKLLLATFRHEFPHVERGARALIAENPRDFAAWGMLGDALMELGRYAEAGEAYQRLLNLRANSESYSRVAWHRFLTGKSEEALGWMALATQAGSATKEGQAWLLTEFAEMLWKLGRAGDAGAAISEALKLAPGSHRAHAVHARMLWDSNPAKARAEMERALAIVPLPEYAAELALHDPPAAAERRWKYVEGLEKITRSQGEKSNRILAILYADAGRNLDRALELVEAEYEVRNDVYSHDARAWVLHKLGRHAEANTWMEKALALGTAEPSFARHAAAINEALAAQDRPLPATR
jgi:tetratricopeptide (TPR) repeat protein